MSDGPRYDYVAYIDEAGDPGLKRVKPDDVNGSSEWMMVSAVVMRAEYEPVVGGWISEIMDRLNSHQMRTLHFAKLSPTRKMTCCEYVADLPVRCFVVCSNKRNMKGHRNIAAERISGATNMPADNWFYCWLSRMLLERVTHFVGAQAQKDFNEPRMVKLVFSERGGLSYTQMNAYFDWLRFKGANQVLSASNLTDDVFHRQLMEIHNHSRHDGLKLPDIVASAFFKAADKHDTGVCDPRFAWALRPRMARWPDIRGGRTSGYGVKLIPSWSTVRADTDQLEIFKRYGYPDQWWS